MNSKSIFFKKMAGLVLGLAFILPSFVYGQDTQYTDPEIASIAVTANQIDVNYAKIILADKSVSKDVKEFAQSMVDDHEAIIKMAVDLATKLGVTPKDNDFTQTLLKGEKETTKMLASKRGKALEKAYIDNEVAYHEAVIDAVKTVLIPQTDNAELKALLQKAAPILDAHLKHAKMVQKNHK